MRFIPLFLAFLFSASAFAEPYPAERAALQRAFGFSEAEKITVIEAEKTFDLEQWLTKLPKAKDEKRREGAVKAYLSVSMAYYLRAAERMKNKKLESPWAKLAFSEAELERLRQMPITFVIHEVREKNGNSLVELQFYPELTEANDKEARAILALSRSANGFLVVDIAAGGVSAYEVLRAGLLSMLSDTEKFILTILEKRIVTAQQLEDFSKP
jgi:hypothetical protein